MTASSASEVEKPQSPSFAQRHRHALAGTAILLLVVFVFLMRSFQILGHTSGDTYSALRYAVHVNDGDGLVWNRGEKPATEGFTNLAWILLLTLPMRWNADPLLWAKLIGIVCTLVTAGICAWVVTRTGRKWTSRGGAFLSGTAAAAALLLQANTPVHAVSGAETAPALLMLTLFFLIVIRYVVVPRRATAALTAALALLSALFRPEFVVAAACAFGAAYLLTSARRQLVRFGIIPFVAVGIAIFLWRAYRAWLWLPLPFFIRDPSDPHLLAGLDGLLMFLRIEWPVLLLALSAMWLISRSGRSLLPPAAAIAGMLLLFLFASSGESDHLRLYHPLTGFLALFAGLAIAVAFERFAERWMVTTIVVALTVYFVWQSDRFGINRSILLEEARATRNGYVLLGKSLADVDPTGSRTIAIGGAPATAYYSGWHTIDLSGRNDRRIALQRRAGSFEANRVIGRRPELLVIDSRQGKVFDPSSADAGTLRDHALKSGFRPAGVLMVRDSLYLWLMTPDPPFVRPVLSALEKRTSPLIR